jgi:hypothetical protein
LYCCCNAFGGGKAADLAESAEVVGADLVHDRGVGVDDSAGFVFELGGDPVDRALRIGLGDAPDGCWWGLLEGGFEGGGIGG